MSDFKNKFDFEHRKDESKRMMLKYPNRIPIVVESKDDRLPPIDKSKYLVPQDITVGQFVYVIRKRINLAPEQAIFVFVNNTLPPTASSISEIYNNSKDEDGFLYIEYTSESTFGSNQRIFC